MEKYIYVLYVHFYKFIYFLNCNHKDPDNVANIKACIPLVNNPNKIKGIGITKGTKETNNR